MSSYELLQRILQTKLITATNVDAANNTNVATAIMSATTSTTAIILI